MRNNLDYKYSCMHGVHDSDEQQHKVYKLPCGCFQIPISYRVFH